MYVCMYTHTHIYDSGNVFLKIKSCYPEHW